MYMQLCLFYTNSQQRLLRRKAAINWIGAISLLRNTAKLCSGCLELVWRWFWKIYMTYSSIGFLIRNGILLIFHMIHGFSMKFCQFNKCERIWIWSKSTGWKYTNYHCVLDNYTVHSRRIVWTKYPIGMQFSVESVCTWYSCEI